MAKMLQRLQTKTNFLEMFAERVWGCCRCWVHKKASCIRGKLKEDNKFKCQVYANEQTQQKIVQI